MTSETEKLVLEHLRHIRTRVDGIASDVQELKQRIGLIEGQVASLFGQYAILSNRIDRMDGRISRIEERLGLVEA
jgi:hypothetical protein